VGGAEKNGDQHKYHESLRVNYQEYAPPPGGKLVSAVTTEDLLFIRKDLLTGYQVMKKGYRTPVKGRKAPSVNNYMTLMSGIFQFAQDNGYISKTRLAELTG
jgi:hypothetical protein